MTNADYLEVDKTKLLKEERILHAAIKVFSEYPFSVATIKMIADEAGLTVASVLYHHKSKEMLYEAVFERLAPSRSRSLERYQEFLNKGKKIDRKMAKTLFVEYLDDFVEGVYNAEKGNWYTRILFFELMYPSPVSDVIYEKYLRNLHEQYVNLLKVTSGIKEHRKAVFRSIGIMGMILSYKMQREHLVRQVDMVAFSREELDELKTMIVRDALTLLGVDV